MGAPAEEDLVAAALEAEEDLEVVVPGEDESHHQHIVVVIAMNK